MTVLFSHVRPRDLLFLFSKIVHVVYTCMQMRRNCSREYHHAIYNGTQHKQQHHHVMSNGNTTCTSWKSLYSVPLVPFQAAKRIENWWEGGSSIGYILKSNWPHRRKRETAFIREATLLSLTLTLPLRTNWGHLFVACRKKMNLFALKVEIISTLSSNSKRESS